MKPCQSLFYSHHEPLITKMYELIGLMTYFLRTETGSAEIDLFFLGGKTAVFQNSFVKIVTFLFSHRCFDK